MDRLSFIKGVSGTVIKTIVNDVPPYVPDKSGFNLGPVVIHAAKQYNIPPTLLYACAMAESELDPHAERYGEWPDWSFGLYQQTVAFLSVDGAPLNIKSAKQLLFDQNAATMIAAKNLAGCYKTSQDEGNGTLLETLLVYNCGSMPDDYYYRRYAANVQRYIDALKWAKGI